VSPRRQLEHIAEEEDGVSEDRRPLEKGGAAGAIGEDEEPCRLLFGTKTTDYVHVGSQRCHLVLGLL
jgi:hypothetical protein